MRRMRGWPEGGLPSMEALHEAIHGLFPETQASGEKLFIAYYADGETCTLTEATLPSALRLAETSGVLRLAAFSESSDQSSASNHASRGSSAEPPPLSEDEFSATQTSAASGHVADSHCNLSDRFFTARPRIVEGLNHFKKQVVDDFRSNCQDMEGAFDSSRRSAGTDAIGQPQETRLVSKVVSIAAGIAAAGRLLPVRGTLLAAHSVAALTGAASPVSQDAFEPNVDAIQAHESSMAAASEDDLAITNLDDQNVASDRAVGSDGVAEEFAHFKKQVAGDFELARQEVSVALGYFVGQDSSVIVELPSGDQGRTYKEFVPAVASSVAGFTVASTMVPLRAARLVIASASAFKRTPPSHDDGADIAGSVAATQEDHVIADEILARRLQAEEDLACQAVQL